MCSDYRADTLNPYASGLTACGCSSMVEPQPSKLAMPVRSRSPAPSISAQIYEALLAYLFHFYAIAPTLTPTNEPLSVSETGTESGVNTFTTRSEFAKVDDPLTTTSAWSVISNTLAEFL